MKKKRKRHVTLIEIMIVMLLIGLIGGALAFNMRGSMDEGRAFKTRQNKHRIEEILYLEESKGELTPEEIEKQWTTLVKQSPLVKGDSILQDGWKQDFTVKYQDGEVIVSSTKLTTYETKKSKKS